MQKCTAVALHNTGNIELWYYTDMIVVGLYRCGNTEPWGCTAVGTQTRGVVQLWERQ